MIYNVIATVSLLFLMIIIECPAIEEKMSALTLKEIIKKTAGLYIDKRFHNKNETFMRIRISDIERTVLITGCNAAYLNHLRNFKCFIDRIGFKATVIAMDKSTHDFIESQKYTNMFSYLIDDDTSTIPSSNNRTRHTSKGVIREQAADFRSPQFNLISNKKIEGVYNIIKEGYHAIFIDPDVVMLRDPAPYLFWDNVDYVHSLNWICPHSNKWDFYQTEEEGNTGFYFIRSTRAAMSLLSLTLKSAIKHPNLDDQSVFWQLIRQLKSPTMSVKPLKKCNDQAFNSSVSNIENAPHLTTCHLDGCVFSVGALRGVAYNWLKDNLAKKREAVVTIHANYIKGNALKMKALQKHGYWITDNKNKCNPFSQNF